jgi:diguanylate cyclase (GGDEF)-like protein
MNWSSHNKRHLIVLTSLLISAGFLATSLASYYVARARIREGIINTALPLTADAIYSEIQRELISPLLISQMMADNTFLRDWVIQGERDIQKITKYLDQTKIRFNAVTSFFVSEQTRFYYYSGGILKKMSESNWRDVWYFRVRKMDNPYEINVDLDLSKNDAMTVFINYRVYDYNHRFIGATGVGLALEDVKKMIDKYRRKYNQRIFFLNAEGQMILSAGDEKWPQKDIRKIEGLSGLADQILERTSGSFMYKSGKDARFLNVRAIPEFGWHLCVEKAEQEAISGIRNVFILNILIFIVVAVVFLFALGMIINRFQTQLEKSATTDKLTGLYNRQAFEVLIEQIVRNYRRTANIFSVIMFDIDDFKHINDMFGHLSGDWVLAEIARVAKTRIRGSDIFCRWGGEEFLVVLPSCDLANALDLAEKIRITVSQIQAEREGRKITVTISAGVAEYMPDETIDQLVSRADQALYAAKKAGKNRSFSQKNIS